MQKLFSLKNDAYPLLKLAFPLALTGLVQSAVWFFETLFLAHLGPEKLAAGSLVGWLYGTLAVILFGALSSINILVAHKHGENDQQSIAFIARDGLLLAFIFTIPAFLLFWNMSPIFLLFGQSASVVILAKAYLQALSWGLFANFVVIACLEVIIGVGHTRLILIYSILSVLLNIFCSYIFIFGKLGFKAYGIAGAGWGMTASYCISAIFLIIFIIANKHYRSYFRYIFTFTKPSFLWELLEIGLPMGFMYCVEVAFFFALTLCMGLLSSNMQAANQVALQYLGLFMTVMFSIAQAVTVRMGHLLGAKDSYSAEKTNGVGICIAITLMTIVAICYWLFPVALISIDFDVNDPINNEMIREIKYLLAICAVFQIFEAVRIVLFGSLRGIKDTKFTLLISIISFWLIALPIGYIFATYSQLGGAAYWWGMVVGAFLSVILLQRRFKYKMHHYHIKLVE